jgi:hypothetical protein
LGLKIFDLNAEGLLKIPGAQKLLPEVSVGCNLLLNVFLEGAYLLLIGAWKASHGPLDHINVALRSVFGGPGTTQKVRLGRSSLWAFNCKPLIQSASHPRSASKMILGFCGLGFMTYRRKQGPVFHFLGSVRKPTGSRRKAIASAV